MPVSRSVSAPSTSNAMMGLSGLDTASMLDQMMLAHKRPIMAAKQKQQLVIWRQEAYRNLIGKIQDFKNKFFDYKTPATNMLTLGNYKKFNVNNTGAEYARISTTTTSTSGKHSLEIKSLPSMSTYTGVNGITKPMKGSEEPDWAGAVGYNLTINMDGLARSITITSEIDSAYKLQEAIDNAFGSGKIIVSGGVGTNPLEFTAGTGVNQITIIDESARYSLGFGSAANNSTGVMLDSTLNVIGSRLNTPLSYVSVPTGELDTSGNPVMMDAVKFSINGKEFVFSKMTSMKTVINTINNDPDAGVTIRYDNAIDAFTMSAKVGGPGNTIKLEEENSNFFEAVGLQLGFVGGESVIAGLEDIDAAAITAINDAIDAYVAITPTGDPVAFSININGIVRTITLDGYLGVGNHYSSVAEIAEHINDQIQAPSPTGFGDSGLSAVDNGDKIEFIVVQEYETSPGVFVPYPNPITQMSFGAAAGQTEEQANAALSVLGFDPTSVARSFTGEFGRVVIDGDTLVIDRTEFEYRDIFYDLRKETPLGERIDFSIDLDTNAVIDVIKQFVEAYNEVIMTIESALSEKRDYSYQPLTDMQIDQMSEKEIEKWEAKAKAGILRSDVNFISLSTKLRTSIFNRVFDTYESTDYVKLSLDMIGISTGSYQDRGVLSINEEMLAAALEEDIDAVARLFANPPEEHVDDPEKSEEWNAKMARLKRDKTGGLAYKLFDILEDYARTARNASGLKGILLEHAGIVNDMSDVTSVLSREIASYDEKLNKLWDRYDAMEKRYIKMLSQLESYATSMSTQNAWLMQQMNNTGSA